MSKELIIEGTAVGNTLQYALSQGYTLISEQGASRSGKTYNTMIFLIQYLQNNPKTVLNVVRATMPALRSSVYEDFVEIMQRLGYWNTNNLRQSPLLVYTFGNGSKVLFTAAADQQKLRGQRRDVLFVNEANELKFKEWQQLKMRTRRFSIIDYNPSFSDEHWICKVNRDPRTYHFITTYRDNKFLEEEIVKEIESLKTTNPSLWRIYGLGLQSLVEGCIFSRYEEVKEFPDYIKRQYIGMDFGYTNDPTAIVRVGILGDKLYLDEIVYRTKMVADDIIKELKKNCIEDKIISESADPRLIDEIHRAGLNIHPVKKYPGSVDAGIAKMQEFKLCVTRNSSNIMKEIKNYTWQKDKEDKWINKPIDAFNHAIDAIRYVILMEVLGGDRVPLNKKKLFRYIY